MSKSIFTTGLALFSMFFGAGNLIFPLIISQSLGNDVWYAIAGLALTAVVVPFLGLAAMILFDGNTERFFGRIGKVPGVALLLLLQLILGPFGVIPRLITLMHAITSQYVPISLLSFSLLMAGMIFVCSFKKERLIGFLGAILTPVLLISLAALVFFGLKEGAPLSAGTSNPNASFMAGLLGGYNTMDLIAAFLFATVILPHFKDEKENQGKKLFLSSLIAAVLLFLTYVGLCLISARHGAGFTGAPEQFLHAIAHQLLGTGGGFIAAIAVIVACLTTAMTLASIFADYLRKEICKDKMGGNWALICTLMVTTLFANLGFAGIARFLGPILEVIYPGLIVLTVVNLLYAFSLRRGRDAAKRTLQL